MAAISIRGPAGPVCDPSKKNSAPFAMAGSSGCSLAASFGQRFSPYRAPPALISVKRKVVPCARLSREHGRQQRGKREGGGRRDGTRIFIPDVVVAAATISRICVVVVVSVLFVVAIASGGDCARRDRGRCSRDAAEVCPASATIAQSPRPLAPADELDLRAFARRVHLVKMEPDLVAGALGAIGPRLPVVSPSPCSRPSPTDCPRGSPRPTRACPSRRCSRT